MKGIVRGVGPRIGAAIAAACLAGGAPTQGLAQECPCEITFDTLAIIGGASTGVGNVVGAYNADRRLLYTSNVSWQDRFFVYEIPEDRAREVSEPVAEVGRAGDGPGDFSRIVGMTLLGDTLVVYDAQHERISLLGPDNALLRTFRTPGRGKLNVLVAYEDHILGEFVEPLRPEDPSLRVLDPSTGQTIRTLDLAEPARSIGYAISIAGARKLATNKNGTVFAAWRSAYEIHAYPPDGEPYALKASRPGFDSQSYLDAMRRRDDRADEAALAQMPPEAIQDAIWIDPATGWVATLLYLPTGRPRSEPGALIRRIEFWDAEARQVRASLSNAPPFEAHVGNGVVLAAHHDDAGAPFLVLIRVQVHTSRMRD
jgi:hypothetical protein